VNSPLTPEHVAQLASAIERTGKIRKASKMAAVNGWVLAISAGLTAPFAPFSGVAFILLFALALLAWNEFRGRKMLDRFEEAGPDLLWKNQVGLMAVVVGYCLWGIRTAVAGPVNPSLAQLEELVPDITELVSQAAAGFYALIIVVTVLLQGVMARFYHNRIALVRDYLAETPDWAVDVIRLVQAPTTEPKRS